MVAIRQFLLLEVARAYRITPHLLQDLTGASFANVTELGRQFVTYTLLPWCMRWTAEIEPQVVVTSLLCPLQFFIVPYGRPNGNGGNPP